jgi:hypothetical protein
MTNKKESPTLARLRALTRIAGPDDPIYQSGLVMNAVRRPVPPPAQQRNDKPEQSATQGQPKKGST